MKLNIVTILLFTVLLSTGFSTKSDAQCWRCHRYGYWAPEHATDKACCSDHWGCRPWRWGRCAAHSCPAMAERWKEDSTNCAKFHEDMKAAHAKYEEGDAILRNSNHGYWGHGYWGRGWWGGWRGDRYYYRGAGY